MKLLVLVLALVVYSQDLLIEEVPTVEATEDNEIALSVLTDSDFDEQPTQIDNNVEEVDYVKLTYEGSEYLVSLDNEG